MSILKEIREEKGLTITGMARKVGLDGGTVSRWEEFDKPSSVVAGLYLKVLPEGSPYIERLLDIIRDNWTYNEDISPISNEVRRIRNGLHKSTAEMSRLLGRHRNYWAELEYRGRSISSRDFEMLDKVFNISSTTIKRHNIIVERVHDRKPIPDAYKVNNPDIEEPYDLYDNQSRQTRPDIYLDLIRQIEDENGGSVLNASVEDPKMIKLREIMGVIYYDEGREQ